MKNFMYSIYDKDLDRFAPVFVCDDDATAKRMFYLTCKGLDAAVVSSLSLWSLGCLEITKDSVEYDKFGDIIADSDSFDVWMKEHDKDVK